MAAIKPGCTVFRNPNHIGENEQMEPNVHLGSSRNNWNNAISSASVSALCKLVDYKGRHCEGASKSFRGSSNNLGGEWNNRISSLLCICS